MKSLHIQRVDSMVENGSTQNSTLSSKRTKLTLLFSILIALCAIALFVYWFWWGRFKESTEDAYVAGNMVELTSQISGIVTAIYTDETRFIEKGQLAIELDTTDAALAFEKSKADLASALREVVKRFEKVSELEAEVEAQKAQFIKKSQDFEHRKKLIASGSVSKEDFEHSKEDFKTSFAELILTKHKLSAAYAEVENTTVVTHPLVEEAKSALREAFVRLKRCSIQSPVSGIVTQRKVQIGEWINPADPLLAIVPIDEIWINANFKEVQLENLRIGQEVKITADMYGRDVPFHGRVAGFNPGTGSVFSLLPPQNATGNWIKIVQRVPVRIALDPKEVQMHPLWLGLSTTVTVDTHDRSGSILPKESSEKALYQTDIFEQQIEGVEEVILQVIQENVNPEFLQEEEAP